MTGNVTLQPFTPVRIQMVIVVVTNVQKRETTILIGTPHHGGTLLFWLTMKPNVTCTDVKVTIECPEVYAKKHMNWVNQSIGQLTTMKETAQTKAVSYWNCFLMLLLTLCYFADTWVQLYAYLDILNITTEAACRGPDRVWAQPWLHEPPACLVLPPEPDCLAAGWTRVNHLGNGRDGVPLNYTWRLPHFPTRRSQRCVLRLR